VFPLLPARNAASAAPVTNFWVEPWMRAALAQAALEDCNLPQLQFLTVVSGGSCSLKRKALVALAPSRPRCHPEEVAAATTKDLRLRPALHGNEEQLQILRLRLRMTAFFWDFSKP
jgi:hypothetical protein